MIKSTKSKKRLENTSLTVNKFTENANMRITKVNFVCEDEKYKTFRMKSNSN